jgi:hypothetical protein
MQTSQAPGTVNDREDLHTSTSEPINHAVTRDEEFSHLPAGRFGYDPADFREGFQALN